MYSQDVDRIKNNKGLHSINNLLFFDIGMKQLDSVHLASKQLEKVNQSSLKFKKGTQKINSSNCNSLGSLGHW